MNYVCAVYRVQYISVNVRKSVNLHTTLYSYKTFVNSWKNLWKQIAVLLSLSSLISDHLTDFNAYIWGMKYSYIYYTLRFFSLDDMDFTVIRLKIILKNGAVVLSKNLVNLNSMNTGHPWFIAILCILLLTIWLNLYCTSVLFHIPITYFIPKYNL